MTDLENFIAKKIKTLVPKYDSLEFNAIINSSSYSIEFFTTIHGKKMQSFQMIDDGIFTESNFNEVAKSIANYCRKLPNFNPNGVNEYTIVLKGE